VTESRNLESTESGQAAISLILILGLFLLGVFGLAVDFTNMWFHRQAATAAADAACQAGAMDMLATAGG
jgi:Flp pilus assembly protein TadG